MLSGSLVQRETPWGLICHPQEGRGSIMILLGGHWKIICLRRALCSETRKNKWGGAKAAQWGSLPKQGTLSKGERWSCLEFPVYAPSGGSLRVFAFPQGRKKAEHQLRLLGPLGEGSGCGWRARYISRNGSQEGERKCTLKKVLENCGLQRPCRYGQPFPVSFKWIQIMNNKHRGFSHCHHCLDKSTVLDAGKGGVCHTRWGRWPMALLLPFWEGWIDTITLWFIESPSTC